MRRNLPITVFLLSLGALAAPSIALADVTVTPQVSTSARASDNAGLRPAGDRQSDVVSDVSAGGKIYWSNPVSSIKAEALGEYERYLSAAVRNTYASGGLDGKWRPDERTSVRDVLKASYAPDRYDPRVPYRVAIAVPDTELPAFVRATTARWDDQLIGERWLTERDRLRITGEAGDTHYSARKAIGADVPVPAIALQSRSFEMLDVTGLRQVAEPAAVGFYATYTSAQYEVSPDAHTVDAGATTEWDVTERYHFAARAGADWIEIPGRHGVPMRFGFNGTATLTRAWESGSTLAVTAKSGTFLTTSALPAANAHEARVDANVAMLERLSALGWASVGEEIESNPAFMATGRYTVFTGGAGLQWAATEHWTARVGYEHDDLATRGLVAVPYRQNLVFVGFTFTGGPFGDPPTNP